MGAVKLPSAKRAEILQNFRFRVAITTPEGFDDSAFTEMPDKTEFVAGFTNVSGLSSEVDVVDYRVGTDPITPRKLEGQVKHGDVTFSTGVDIGKTLSKWFLASNGDGRTEGPSDKPMRCDVFVDVYARGGPSSASDVPVQRYVLNNALISKYEAGELDAMSSDAHVEMITFAHEGLLPVPFGRA